MWIVGVAACLVVAAAWRRRTSNQRRLSAASGQRVTAPSALRHPDQDGARWLHGVLAMGGDEVPVWTGNPDQISMRVELPASRFTLSSKRSGLSEVTSIAPGLVIVRLESAAGPLDIALAPPDAELLARYFAPVGDA